MCGNPIRPSLSFTLISRLLLAGVILGCRLRKPQSATDGHSSYSGLNEHNINYKPIQNLLSH